MIINYWHLLSVMDQVGRESVLKRMVEVFADAKATFPPRINSAVERPEFEQMYSRFRSLPSSSDMIAGHGNIVSPDRHSQRSSYYIVIGASGVGKTTLVTESMHRLDAINGRLFLRR